MMFLNYDNHETTMLEPGTGTRIAGIACWWHKEREIDLIGWGRNHTVFSIEQSLSENSVSVILHHQTQTKNRVFRLWKAK